MVRQLLFATFSAFARGLAVVALAAIGVSSGVKAGVAENTTAPGGTPAAPKAAAKPAAKKPGAPSGVQSPTSPEPGQGASKAAGPGQLVFSPWTKICGKDGPAESNAKTVCLIVKEARLETGQLGAGAALVEPEGEQRKILRVTLPLGMQIPQGTRLSIDQTLLAQRPYMMCLPNGCLSDYEAEPDLVAKLKKGQGLIIQALSVTGEPIQLALPLTDFAKAYDGPPTDQKVLAEQQKKLQEELQRRAEEARKNPENQQSQSAQPAAEGQPAAAK